MNSETKLNSYGWSLLSVFGKRETRQVVSRAHQFVLKSQIMDFALSNWEIIETEQLWDKCQVNAQLIECLLGQLECTISELHPK